MLNDNLAHKNGDSSPDFGGPQLQTDSFIVGFFIGLVLNIVGFIILWSIFNSMALCPGCVFSLYPFIGMPLVDVLVLIVLLFAGRWRTAVGIVAAVFALVATAVALLSSRSPTIRMPPTQARTLPSKAAPTFILTSTLPRTATPSPLPLPASQVIGSGKFNGHWRAAFTLQFNTVSQEINRPWFTFNIDLHQQGNNVTGTIASPDVPVTGTLQGVVDEMGVFHGTMRLSWDSHDWESLSLRISPDGSSGIGTAIYPAAMNQWHFYTIELLPASN